MKLFVPVLIIFSVVQVLAQNENPLPVQEWQYPYQVHTITISDSLEIAYIEEGKNNKKGTLLFIHGLGSNLKAWQKNIDFLKKDYHCIALDLPGYGKSKKGEYSFDMTFFAETIQAFIAKMDLKKVVLVGHSMGGQIAMHVVLNDSKNIEKLLLIAPAGFETFTEEETTWLQNFYTPAFVKATPEEQIVKNFEINFYAMPADARFMIEDRMLMRLTAAYDYYCNMVPRCVMGMLSEPVFDRLTEIQLPTLVIFGENDMLIPNKYLHPNHTTFKVAKNGQGLIPDSELKMVPLAGHFVQWEQSKRVNELITDFLK